MKTSPRAVTIYVNPVDGKHWFVITDRKEFNIHSKRGYAYGQTAMQKAMALAERLGLETSRSRSWHNPPYPPGSTNRYSK